MALNNNALLTLIEAKRYLNIPTAEVSRDPLIEEFINATSSLIENYCNRNFRAKEHTERYNGVGINEILLNHWPILAITSVKIDSSRKFLSDSLLDTSNYEVFKNEKDEGYIIERFDTTFPKGKKNIQIIYTSGYPTINDIPSDLALACKISLAFYYEQQQQKNWTFSNKSKGDENITLVQGLPESAVLILESYQRFEIIGQIEPIRNW